MPALSLIGGALSDAERNTSLYGGEVLVFRSLSAMGAIIERLRAHVREHIGDAPEYVHQRLDEAALAETVQTLRRRVQDDPQLMDAVRCMLAETGMDLDDNYHDGLKIRAQPPHSTSGAPSVAPLAAHRDTWATNIMAQCNWWAPLYPTTAARTIALFPTLFDRPVANDSEGWDFSELVRRLKHEGSATGYALLPTATEPPAWNEALAISIEPGDLMAFSSAHLHASVPNETDRTRISFELRTVTTQDIFAGRGATNVDGDARRVTWQLFRRLSNGDRLGKLI